MHRTNIVLDERLVERAKRLTGAKTTRAAVELALERLVAEESAGRGLKRLAALGGTIPEAKAPRRRRPSASAPR